MGTQARAFRSGPMSQHPERSPAWNLGPESAREEDMNNYSVYCLYTKIEGIFSIGYGKVAHNAKKSGVSGTASEWKQQRTKTLNTRMKWRYIRACEARRIPIYREVVSSCETKQRAEEVKYLIFVQISDHAFRGKGTCVQMNSQMKRSEKLPQRVGYDRSQGCSLIEPTLNAV